MTHFPKLSLLPALSLSLILAACAPTSFQAENLSAKPFNQLELAGNACGPAALLNSYRFGKTAWRQLAETPPGLSDRDRIRAIARGPAMRPSASLPGRARWSRSGINISDLRDIANELGRPTNLPPLTLTSLLQNPAETPATHLKAIHSSLAKSLSAGFPPIVSLRLYIERSGSWTSERAHFVTITSIPGSLPPNATDFPVKFIDPLGGTIREGRISIGSEPKLAFFPQADFPTISIGKNLLSPSQNSYLALATLLGIQ